ncbi:TatD family hydrolase [Shigella flexneri]
METDSPYLAPVPHRGKRINLQSFVTFRIHGCVERCCVEELAQVTTDNFARSFHIDASRLQSIR